MNVLMWLQLLQIVTRWREERGNGVRAAFIRRGGFFSRELIQPDTLLLLLLLQRNIKPVTFCYTIISLNSCVPVKHSETSSFLPLRLNFSSILGKLRKYEPDIRDGNDFSPIRGVLSCFAMKNSTQQTCVVSQIRSEGWTVCRWSDHMFESRCFYQTHLHGSLRCRQVSVTLVKPDRSSRSPIVYRFQTFFCILHFSL